MPNLTSAPLWISVLLFVVALPLAAMTGPLVVRRFVSFERLRGNNEVAGFKFATVGVLYAVLLAFVVIVVWEKFSQAENEVAAEAGAAATLYRLWEGFGADHRTELEAVTTAYLATAVDDEWPAMATGHESRAATEALNALYARVLAIRPGGGFDSDLLREALVQLDDLTEARRLRLVMAAGIVPDLVWAVLFGGAALTIGFTFFFGAENLRAQALMTGALALLIFAVLLLIVAIDRPFAGTVSVRPDALADVLADFGGVQR